MMSDDIADRYRVEQNDYTQLLNFNVVHVTRMSECMRDNMDSISLQAKHMQQRVAVTYLYTTKFPLHDCKCCIHIKHESMIVWAIVA